MNRTVALLLLAVAGFLHPLLLKAETVDRIVAIVGNEIITSSDLKRESKSLDELIQEKLLKVEMERLQVTVPDDELRSAIQEVLQRNKITLPQLKEELAKKGVSFENYRRDLKEQIQKMKFLSQVIFPRIRISEDEILKKAKSTSEEERTRVRWQLLQERSEEELKRYLNEVRAKTYVDIKK